MTIRSVRRNAGIIVIALAALAFSSCSRGQRATPRSDPAALKALSSHESGLADSFDSAALAKNTLGDPSRRAVLITLPPSYYDEGDRRYPVVYYLHGHSEGAGAIWRNRNYVRRAMESGAIPEMIVVEPDGSTRFGGGFYAKLPGLRNHADYLTEELVPFIDANYRTIAAAQARGLAGFSMGGFGALYNGLRRPDVFGAVFAFAPGVLVPGGLPVAMEAWGDDAQFLSAYASAFSPTPGAKEPGRVPALDGSDADKPVVADWEAGFGDWDRKIADYLARPERLRALRLVYGRNDEYRFIREGCPYLHEQLDSAGVAHEFAVTSDQHRLRVGFVVEDLLSFMGKSLAATDGGR